MPQRPIGPFIDSSGGYNNHSRRPRILHVLMLLMLVVVLFVVFKVIPQGPGDFFLRERQVRKQLAEADAMESQSLNALAAESYQRIADNEHISKPLRAQAARGLARVYRAMPNRLSDVEAALEKAYLYTPAGPDRDAVRDELETLRGRPLAAVDTHATAAIPAVPLRSTSSTQVMTKGNPYPLPADARVLARIGDESVSMEEILYAWGQFNGMRNPTEEQLRPFVKMYLDMVLLADEAHNRGIDRQPATVYDLRIRRVMSLNQMITEKLIRDLKTPDAKALRQYYDTHKPLFTTPAYATLGAIIVRDRDDAEKVKKALDQGQRFDTVARKYNSDSDKLKDGYILGQIAQNDPNIPGYGTDPRLVLRLLALGDGATTGPLETKNGQYWLRVINKTSGQLRPFNEIQDDVLLSFQKQALAENRTSLLQQLHKERPVEILDVRLRQDLAPDSASVATTSTAGQAPPAAAAAATTTGTAVTGTASAPALATVAKPVAATPKPAAEKSASIAKAGKSSAARKRSPSGSGTRSEKAARGKSAQDR